MKKHLFLLFFIDILSVGVILYFFNTKLLILNDKMTQLQQTIIYKENFNAKIVNSKLKNQINAVVSIRCTYKKLSWKGSGIRVSEDVFLTANHVIAYLGKDTNYKTVYAEACTLYDKGKKVGSFKEYQKNYRQFENRDIAVFRATLNLAASKNLSMEKPQVQKVMNGQPLILISHPDIFDNDPIVTFGLVVSTNIQNSLEEIRKESWKNAILTDMSATGGSSGAPIFTTDGSFIGIHVGGKRDMGLNINYQLLFEKGIFKFCQDFQIQ